MSQSIKRDGWYFRSFGYIKRELSLLTLYYLPSYRILGPGSTEAAESAAASNICPWDGRLSICGRPRLASSMAHGDHRLIYVALRLE